jgi:hypothetical protein
LMARLALRMFAAFSARLHAGAPHWTAVGCRSGAAQNRQLRMVQSLRFGTALPRKVLGRVSFWKITGSSGSGSSRSEAETVDNGTFIGDLHR